MHPLILVQWNRNDKRIGRGQELVLAATRPHAGRGRVQERAAIHFWHFCVFRCSAQSSNCFVMSILGRHLPWPPLLLYLLYCWCMYTYKTIFRCMIILYVTPYNYNVPHTVVFPIAFEQESYTCVEGEKCEVRWICKFGWCLTKCHYHCSSQHC